MNRPIRFRIWEPASKCFIGIETFIGDGYRDLSDNDPFVVSQFTGLQDSKGVDIFEGDIVTYDTGDADENDRYAKLLTSEVRWNLDRWRISYSAATYCWTKMTVIGNIFEHPNLIS